MVTIRDIAAIAGVSVSTVSRYLSGALKVKEDTAARIDNAIKETNYCRNINAASIKNKCSNTIALVIPSMKNLAFAEIAESINSILTEKGYSLVTYTTNDNLEMEKQASYKLRENRVAGAIFITEPIGNKDMSHINILEEEGIKTILINRFYSPTEFNCISTDYRLGAKKVIDYLLAANYRKIGMILGWAEQEQSKAYINGYKEAIEKYGLDYDENLIKFCYYKEPKTKEVTLDLINKGVDAIFTISDYSALISLDLIENTKLRISDDIAVIGSGNTEFSRLIKMTSLNTRHQLLGERGAKMILSKIDGKKCKQFVLLEPDIVIRNTSKKL